MSGLPFDSLPAFSCLLLAFLPPGTIKTDFFIMCWYERSPSSCLVSISVLPLLEIPQSLSGRDFSENLRADCLFRLKKKSNTTWLLVWFQNNSSLPDHAAHERASLTFIAGLEFENVQRQWELFHHESQSNILDLLKPSELMNIKPPGPRLSFAK